MLVLLFDDVQSLVVSGPVEVFTGAALYAGDPGGAYRIRTASLDGRPVRTGFSTARTEPCVSRSR